MTTFEMRLPRQRLASMTGHVASGLIDARADEPVWFGKRYPHFTWVNISPPAACLQQAPIIR